MLIKQIFRPTEQLRSSIAFFSDAVKAGFPSPAQDYQKPRKAPSFRRGMKSAEGVSLPNIFCLLTFHFN